MGDVIYKPLIEDMTWSFSRVESFDMCKYKWFLRYIRNNKEEDMFYTSYGTFMHEILSKFYNGELDKQQMLIYFLLNFKDKVRGFRPRESTVKKYINSGVEYLKGFEPFDYNVVAVEKKIDFDIDGIPFTGFIDLIGEKDGEYCIVDHKSRELSPRSNRKKPTAKDKELDNMLKQLYIYSEAIYKLFGKYPQTLAFNCFRNGEFIEETFNIDVFNQTKEWAVNEVHRIENEEGFAPNQNQFVCQWLCGLSDKCEYYLEEMKGI